MSFKKGDSVLVLDEELSGIIKNIANDTITIETTDGFLLNFKTTELIKNQKKQSLKRDAFSLMLGSLVCKLFFHLPSPQSISACGLDLL